VARYEHGKYISRGFDIVNSSNTRVDSNDHSTRRNSISTGSPHKLSSDGNGPHVPTDAVPRGDAKELAVNHSGSETEWGIERCGANSHTGNRCVFVCLHIN